MFKNILIGFFCLILILGFNFFVADNALISHPCHYHSHDTTIVIDFLYDFPAAEGFHPVWSRPYWLLNLTLAISLAIFFVKKQTLNKLFKVVTNCPDKGRKTH